jgi:hypothetical protein
MTKNSLLSLYHANVRENFPDVVVAELEQLVRPRASHVMSTLTESGAHRLSYSRRLYLGITTGRPRIRAT